MAASSFPFKLDQTGLAADQTEKLLQSSGKIGRSAKLVVALERIYRGVKTDPLHFGDPLYNTLLPGGVVCHVARFGLAVRYVVFKDEKKVVILDVLPIGNEWKQR